MKTFFVDCSAKCAGDGSASAPFKTLAEAQTAVRNCGRTCGGIYVRVSRGEYRLTDTLKFDPADGGSPDCPVVYLGDGAAVTGGVTLNSFDFVPLDSDEKSRLSDPAAADKVRKLDLTKYGVVVSDLGHMNPRGSFTAGGGVTYSDRESELFCDGARQTVARWPDEGYEKVLDVPEGGAEKDGSFTCSQQTAEHLKKWRSFDGVWVFGYFQFHWADGSYQLRAADTDKAELTLAALPQNGIKKDGIYYFYNVFEELDRPGEYYIDRERLVLYYYPQPGFEKSRLTLSTLASDLISADGASDLSFEGFDFSCGRSCGASLRSVSRVRFGNCRFSDLRLGGVDARGVDITVEGCEICATGTFGAALDGGDRRTLTPSHNTVKNCRIHDFSQVVRTYQPAVRMDGCGGVISHNEIYNSPHTAILYGGNDHMIEYNEIYHVCMDTDDAGAIYSGRAYDWYGTVTRYNYLHDIGAAGSDTNGIYWDDNLSGQTAYGNVLVNVYRAFLIGGGRDSVAYNNLIVNSHDPIHFDERGREGAIEKGWYGNPLRPSTTEMERLAQVPYREGVWAEKYLHLASIKLDYEHTDSEDPDLGFNPSYGEVHCNAVFRTPGFGEVKSDIRKSVPRFSKLYDNVDLGECATDRVMAFAYSDCAKIAGKLPDFKAIPFDEIGIEHK